MWQLLSGLLAPGALGVHMGSASVLMTPCYEKVQASSSREISGERPCISVRQEMSQLGHFSLLLLQLHLPPGHLAEYLPKLWANRHMERKSDAYGFKLQAFRVIHCTSVVTGAAGIPNGG